VNFWSIFGDGIRKGLAERIGIALDLLSDSRIDKRKEKESGVKPFTSFY